MPFGILKHDMLYTGKACNTDLIITSFPASLKNLVFQLQIFFATLSLIKSKTYFLDLLITKGSPKYLLSFCYVTFISSRHIPFLHISLNFLLNKMEDFTKFIFCPKHASYLAKISLIHITYSSPALHNSKESSTKKR